ncbi:DMT family transporter, partial [Adlercreutzia sp. DFI.6.23]|uniref:DMT family transporter n=1 Tax=Adlercreutzia sp. DFI.6.23 TaxID=2963705 RepID=UPI002108F129
YKLMLLAATIIWGFAFVVMKDADDVLPPAQLIGVRFFLTGLLMAAVFHRSLKGALNGPCLKAGLVLAVVTLVAFWVQTVGLADTTPGKNAFLTATYCVIVPFMLWAVAGKRPISPWVVLNATAWETAADPGLRDVLRYLQTG